MRRFGSGVRPSRQWPGLGWRTSPRTRSSRSPRGHGLLSLVAVLGSLYPVVTVLLAHVLLHERLTRKQKAGIAIALAGVVAIAGG